MSPEPDQKSNARDKQATRFHHSPEMRRILAAVDGSPLGYIVTKRAYELAQSLGAELTVLSVLSSDPMRKIGTSDEENHLRAHHLELITQLFPPKTVKAETSSPDGILYKCGSHGEARIESRVKPGDPVDRTCREADEIGADFIVIGNRGLGNIGTILLGSVSEKIVRKSSRSVFVVKDMTTESANWEKIGSAQRTGHRFG